MSTAAALSRRLENALDAAALSRIGSIAALPGNPLGVETRHWGDLTATLVRQPTLYYGYYNAIRGLTDASSDALPEALAWFEDENTIARATTSPLLAEESTLAALEASGMRLTGAMSLVYGPPTPSASANSIAVAELPRDGRKAMTDLWLGEAPEADRPFLASLCQAEFAEWRVYVAIDAEPAGSDAKAAGGSPVTGLPMAYGCLYVTDGIGVLASGYTHPDHRNRGLQTALLQRRIADAASSGCDLILSTATPGSQSERNLRRAGLIEGYTQSIWST